MANVINFNVPTLAVVPILAIDGNPVANPTPIIIDGIQGFDLTLKGSIKQLMAEKQFAIAGARGESSVDGKIKAVKNSAETIASIYTGQGYSSVTVFQDVSARRTGTLTTNTLVVGPAGSGIATGTGNDFIQDLGVVNLYGTVYVRVASAPAAGQYMVAIASGVATYTFNATEITAGLIPYVSYISLTSVPPTGSVSRGFTITNQIGGATPVVQLVANTSFQGRKCTLILPWTISSNLNLLSLKNLEFSGYEIDFSCFPDRTVTETIVTGFFLE